VLIEALGWIRRFRDKVTVIKLGGSVMETRMRCGICSSTLCSWKASACAPWWCMAAARHRSRHGGRRLEPKKIQGRRVTDDATLKIVEEVLAYETCEKLPSKLKNWAAAPCR